jgi:hypothetical protein
MTSSGRICIEYFIRLAVCLTVVNTNVNLDNPWAPIPAETHYNFNKSNPAFAPWWLSPGSVGYETHAVLLERCQRQVSPICSCGKCGNSHHPSGMRLSSTRPSLWDWSPHTQHGTGPVSYPVCTTAGNVNQRRF